jgi:hypothetical protein
MRTRIGRTLAALLLSICAATPALAALGDCGQPQSAGDKPSAGDALAILKAAVSQVVVACAKVPCICDVSGDGNIQAADALITLKVAVGQMVPLACKCPVTTSTSSTSTSTTTLPPALTWTEIQDNFKTTCAGAACHDGSHDNGSLSNIDNKTKAYNEMLSEAVFCSPSTYTDKKRVVPGHPEQSILMEKLDTPPESAPECGSSMPLGGPQLSQNFRDGIRAWILDGAPNN